MNKTLVIIPCYNEQENIGNLIDKLFSLNLGLDVLIVDDSHDATADLVKIKQQDKNNLFLIKRIKKSGRGSAVIEGLKFGLNKYYDFFVEMDADFSHNPDELISLLALARLDAVVVSSRYVEGSQILNWPLRRRIFSKLANFYADFILGIGINDYTNGYRVYGRKAIEKLDFSRIKSDGYIVLSEIAYQLFKKDVKFFEQKTIFINRKRGASNFSFDEAKDAFLSVLRIKQEIGDL